MARRSAAAVLVASPWRPHEDGEEELPSAAVARQVVAGTRLPPSSSSLRRLRKFVLWAFIGAALVVVIWYIKEGCPIEPKKGRTRTSQTTCLFAPPLPILLCPVEQQARRERHGTPRPQRSPSQDL
jgi:hypothetical protein